MYAGLGKSRNPEKRFIILITRSVLLTSFVRAKDFSPLRHCVSLLRSFVSTSLPFGSAQGKWLRSRATLMVNDKLRGKLY